MTEAQIAYRVYLESDHWKWLRAQAISFHGCKCFQCGATKRLEVHHINYRHPWDSCTVDDVRPICPKCHRKEHGIKLERTMKKPRKCNWNSNSRANRRRKQWAIDEFNSYFG